MEDKTYFQLQSLLSDPAVQDSHQALLQLVTTLGYIVSKCDPWFRDDGESATLLNVCQSSQKHFIYNNNKPMVQIIIIVSNKLINTAQL